jgi:hypothetical protein
MDAENNKVQLATIPPYSLRLLDRAGEPERLSLVLSRPGISALDVAGEKINEIDRADCAKLFLDLYGKTGRYFEKDQVTGVVRYTGRLKLLFDHIEREGWSRARFQAAMTRWPSIAPGNADWWTIKDFCHDDTPQLHEYSWVKKQVDEDRTAMRRMVGYDVYGRKLYGWAAEVPALPYPKFYDGPAKSKPVEPEVAPTQDNEPIQDESLARRIGRLISKKKIPDA